MEMDEKSERKRESEGDASRSRVRMRMELIRKEGRRGRRREGKEEERC